MDPVAVRVEAAVEEWLRGHTLGSSVGGGHAVEMAGRVSQESVQPPA